MNRVKHFLTKLEFMQERLDLEFLDISLSRVGGEVRVFYSTKKTDEIYFDELCYTTEIEGDELGYIEAYINLAQGKPVEGVDRISIKEFDYFLRKENSVPSFSHYEPEMFDILSIGEELRKKIIPRVIVEEFILNLENDGPFEELSYSEQLDYIEEFLAKYIYSEKKFEAYSFDFEIDSDIVITVASTGLLSKDNMSFIETGLIRELHLTKFKIRFN
jgi:hypothetical protein